jgi:hypothetical protein
VQPTTSHTGGPDEFVTPKADDVEKIIDKMPAEFQEGAKRRLARRRPPSKGVMLPDGTIESLRGPLEETAVERHGDAFSPKAKEHMDKGDRVIKFTGTGTKYIIGPMQTPPTDEEITKLADHVLERGANYGTEFFYKGKSLGFLENLTSHQLGIPPLIPREDVFPLKSLPDLETPLHEMSSEKMIDVDAQLHHKISKEKLSQEEYNQVVEDQEKLFNAMLQRRGRKPPDGMDVKSLLPLLGAYGLFKAVTGTNQYQRKNT